MTWRIVIPLFAAVFALAITARSMPGGLSDVDVNSAGVQNALKFAVAQHNKGSNDQYLTKVMRVTKAKSQVVAGIKYIITADLGRTNCRKSSTTEDCTVHADLAAARPYQCTFTVWSRPWEGFIQATENCTSSNQ